MSLKLKALGLGLLALMATGAFAAMSATAQQGGHFTSHAGVTHTIVKGTENLPPNNHHLDFTVVGIAGEIGCETATYEGTTNANTVTSLTITPNWDKCYTTSAPNTKFPIDENGCTLTFTIGKVGGPSHHTVDVICPPGKAIEITHPSCNITVPPQTVGGAAGNGVVYTPDTLNGKSAITLDSTVSGITTHLHSPFCQGLFGTTRSGNMIGSATVHGTDTVGNPVGITATTG